MKVRVLAVPAMIAALCVPSAFAQSSPEQRPSSIYTDPASSSAAAGRWFYGGYIGASFGDVEYVEIAPMVGYRVHPRFTTGVGAFWRYRDDGRYSPSITTNDYGGSVFAQAYVTKPIFVQAEYEYTNYEYPTTDGGTNRDSYSAFLLGVGFFKPLGGNVGFYASALYNLSYDSNDLSSPYNDPWVYRLGVSVGF
jgi:hypothetical protein